MLTVDRFDEYLRVAGYPDGSDWWVLIPDARDYERWCGLAGPEHVWYVERNGRVHILHAPSRRRVAQARRSVLRGGQRLSVLAGRGRYRDVRRGREDVRCAGRVGAPDPAALRRSRGRRTRALLRRHHRACGHQGTRVDRRCRRLRVLGFGLGLLQHARRLREDLGRVGLRDAVVVRDPRAIARHIAGHLAEAIRTKVDPGRYGTGGLDKLAKDIPERHEPWAAAFFDELERIFAS
jgi:hypothetical protein